MKYFSIAITVLFSTMVQAEPLNPRYFANKEVQRLSPEAFALQPESRDFHKNLGKKIEKEMKDLIQIISDDKELKESILNFSNLDWSQKEKILRSVFALEVKSLNIKAPELIIDSGHIKGQAFFDFDIENPTPGKVILNPVEIQKDANPHTALLLLIHETRHSAQFQHAFLRKDYNGPLKKFYQAAFIAQKKHADKITSFCDFLTLNNEYEAFMFSNYILSVLTNSQVDTLGMGTYASQYNPDFTLKIDLAKLFKEDHSETSILDKFNILEKVQYDLLTK